MRYWWVNQNQTYRHEIGAVGDYWEAIGWNVDVSFRELSNRIRPEDPRLTRPPPEVLAREIIDGLQPASSPASCAA